MHRELDATKCLFRLKSPDSIGMNNLYKLGILREREKSLCKSEEAGLAGLTQLCGNVPLGC